jgi:asparagine synthase (glutamine-hydrolysing)
MEVLEDVVCHLETDDVITVRAAIPMFLLMRAVRRQGIKVVLCGEGADEIFGGYSLFEKYGADSCEEYAHEIGRRLQLIATAELLRVDRVSMAYTVEARVPFLDVDFVRTALSFSPIDRMSHVSLGRMEKFLLRRSVAHLLPVAVTYRKKVQFADGVGAGWLRDLKSAVAESTAYAAVLKEQVSLLRLAALMDCRHPFLSCTVDYTWLRFACIACICMYVCIYVCMSV